MTYIYRSQVFATIYFPNNSNIQNAFQPQPHSSTFIYSEVALFVFLCGLIFFCYYLALPKYYMHNLARLVQLFPLSNTEKILHLAVVCQCDSSRVVLFMCAADTTHFFNALFFRLLFNCMLYSVHHSTLNPSKMSFCVVVCVMCIVR